MWVEVGSRADDGYKMNETLRVPAAHPEGGFIVVQSGNGSAMPEPGGRPR
jgi:hypothetical protein